MRPISGVMRMRSIVTIAIFAMAGSVCARASEPSCYSSSAEAAAQVGVRGVEGYRLETLRRDALAGTVWAIVKSCGHPERPGVMVLASVGSGIAGSFAAGMARSSEATVAKALVMLAGTKVRLVQTSDNIRVEMGGVAQSSGAIGDVVRVRLMEVSLDGSPGDQASWAPTERFATGVVRSRDLVEVEAP
jgi:hypothetical protein